MPWTAWTKQIRPRPVRPAGPGWSARPRSGRRSRASRTSAHSGSSCTWYPGWSVVGEAISSDTDRALPSMLPRAQRRERWEGGFWPPPSSDPLPHPPRGRSAAPRFTPGAVRRAEIWGNDSGVWTHLRKLLRYADQSAGNW
eukprot:gene12290-biopygen403